MYFQDDKMQEKGIDWDLSGCLQYNPQDGFNLGDIQKVLAVWEGENDGPDWHWVLRLNDNRFVYLRGGCDYTGWDCRSSASHIVMSEEIPLKKAMGLLSYEWDSSDLSEIYTSLNQQINTKKNKVWSEQAQDDLLNDTGE